VDTALYITYIAMFQVSIINVGSILAVQIIYCVWLEGIS